MKEDRTMDDKTFRAFLDLLMCSDPWPSDNDGQTTLVAFADAEAGRRGFEHEGKGGWVVAYHDFSLLDPVEAAP